MVHAAGAGADWGVQALPAPAGDGEHRGRAWLLMLALGCSGRTLRLSGPSSTSPGRSALTSCTSGLQVPASPCCHPAHCPAPGDVGRSVGSPLALVATSCGRRSGQERRAGTTFHGISAARPRGTQGWGAALPLLRTGTAGIRVEVRGLAGSWLPLQCLCRPNPVG